MARPQNRPLAAEAAEMVELQDTGTGRLPRVLLVVDGRETAALDIPPGAIPILQDLLKAMGAGMAIPAATEITVEQAAPLLNVSPPYVLRLIEQGTLPARTARDEHRLLLKDVLIYKAEKYAKALKAMEEITAFDQEHGLR